MRLIVVSLILPLVMGCHAALTRDQQCLARLMPEELSARQQENALLDAWREVHHALYAERQRHPIAKPWLLSPLHDPADAAADRPVPDEDSPVQRDLERQHEEAYRSWQEARARHAPLHERYAQVGKRIDVRLEEDRIRSDVFAGLFPTSAMLFYPLVTWALHRALWDDTDPDSERDPVTHFCLKQLEATPDLER